MNAQKKVIGSSVWTVSPLHIHQFSGIYFEVQLLLTKINCEKCSCNNELLFSSPMLSPCLYLHFERAAEVLSKENSSESHGMVWVGRDAERPPSPTPVPWVGTSCTRSGCLILRVSPHLHTLQQVIVSKDLPPDHSSLLSPSLWRTTSTL